MQQPYRSRRRFLGLAAAALAGIAPLPALAAEDAFPSRPMRFIVPFPAGSGTDTTARMFAKKIGELTGQGVVVENKPGGNGFIGVQTALNAPADGYTVFIGSNSTLSTNAATFRKLPYDPLTDFAPITLLSRGPCVVIVPAGSPYRTLAELLEDARKRPGALNYGTGSISYTLYSEWLNELAKVKTTPVPYKGAGDAINGVMAANVDFAVVDASGAIELVRGGRIRALAYTAPQRSPLLPDVPSVVEAGLPDFLAYNWVAAAISAKTPPAVVKRLQELFMQAGNAPDVRDYYTRQSTTLILSSPAEMRQYQKDEIVRWKRLAAVAKIPLQ
ncbi:Bug family tripartite tricarboxylate transporter substrate binding protein [Cupriavidus oxalaticus]|jgi:tripartite-type tricarboxylate transporter receptor subunit TctC|uniref:ABC transporter substrate-binding protein n=1 Tax=Cupriavidus oxalaticus TaxID=96344 RepID=A0A375GEP2_9BURK|nr:tripartite tricarboxylate transporter substrate binding protein [Cupriavidus oxalaticus]QEZ44827.1 tripartite tricarboxylate transporter substrate binding protein [Cupriavidus oxalaticus]QRQ83796.1 tripartite tricarboxylate transporter substrate binding protein [Cupriavidus oxalaticus]QRQ92115.1 tripartite tricarboxylate transporter substrate binding protein [Cupriavidus oxalaticus]WQD86714.1 tripartite tricarboxylate transporter substrate binding protein [Cupriavidus oxalaticus]SPC10001.1 